MTQTLGLRGLSEQYSPAQKRWLSLRMACGLIWIVELFLVQKLSFAAVPSIRFPTLVQFFRLYFDVIFVLAAVFLLRRRWLAALLAINFIALLIIGTYVAHFHRPLMPTRIYHGLHEVWSLRPHLADLLSPVIALVLAATLTLKLLLVINSGTYPLQRWWRAVFGSLSLLLYFVPVIILQFTNLRLTVNPRGGMQRNVYAYGYSMPWVCDLLSNRAMEAHAQRAQKRLGVHYDRLSPLEKPIEILGHLIILQLESIEVPAVEARVKEVWVMPFLQDLKKQSMFFRLEAFHYNGSCDMDYATVTFTEPYRNVVPYRLPGMKYTNSLPAFMKGHGFKTYFYHGNFGLYYDRGPVLEKLGFDGMYFKEQLMGRGLKTSVLGVRDAEIFRSILETLSSAKRACVFAITLDTHVPFKELDPSEMELFPRPSSEIERYLNSARYLDNSLRDFVSKLPDGSTLVLYGDHTPSLKSESYRSDVIDGKEYVCCFIYTKGRDLAASQLTREMPVATDGTLNLLDVMSYLRYSIENGHNVSPTGGAKQTLAPAHGSH